MSRRLNRKQLYRKVEGSCLIMALAVGFSVDAAQLSRQRSSSGVAKAESLIAGQTETKKGYLMSSDKWNFGIRPYVNMEYNSNVYRSLQVGGDTYDLILRPGVSFDVYRAISDFNNLDISLDISTDVYTKNTDLNTYAPIISPDSEFAYHIFVGDAHIKLRESFSYQEDINTEYSYESGGQFTDIKAIRFGRYDNLLGAAVDMDVGSFMFTGTFDWEWFHSNSSRYAYLDRNSALLGQSATYFITPNIQVGLEANDPVHFFAYHSGYNAMHDQFRLDVGPFYSMRLGRHLDFKVGGGYAYADFYADKGEAVTDTLSDWYAYAGVNYDPTPWLRNSFNIRRDNRISWNSDNMESLSVSDSVTLSIMRDVALSLFGAIYFNKETGVRYQGRDDANSSYYSGGVRVAYTRLEKWRPSLRYTYYTYSRDNATYDDYDVHQFILGVQYTF